LELQTTPPMLLTSDNLRITIAPGKRSRKPCTRGIRTTGCDMVESLAAGMPMDEILSDFAAPTAEKLRACLARAAEYEGRVLARLAHAVDFDHQQSYRWYLRRRACILDRPTDVV
jgi:uncharacterized protein (DUF433 family)